MKRSWREKLEYDKDLPKVCEASDIKPFWRTLKTGGEINPKYPGGVQGIARRLRAEGHKVEAKGKRLMVADYQTALYAGSE